MGKFYRLLSVLIALFCVISFSNGQGGIQISPDKTEGCAPLTVHFTNNTHMYMDTTGKTFKWNFPDTVIYGYNVTYTYKKAGHFSGWIETNCCTAPIPQVNVYGAPDKITTSSGYNACPQENIQFWANVDKIDWMKWDFGDGKNNNSCTTCSYTNHSYATSGSYTIRLILSSSTCKITDTITQVMTINNTAKPTIQGLGTNGTRFCPEDKIAFGINNPDIYDSILWNFGDGTLSNEKFPSHGFKTMGGKTIIVTVWNKCGNSASDTTYVQIYNNISVDKGFWTEGDPNNICPGNQVNFKPNGTGSKYYWWFGDGETSFEKTPVHYYNDTGSYTVKFKILNNCGFSDSSTKLIQVKYNPAGPNKPGANIYFNNMDSKITSLKICPNEEIAFRNDSWSNSSDGITYLWDFGDGKTSTIKNATHTWTDPTTKTYKVIMTAKNNCLATAKDTLQVTVDMTTPPTTNMSVLQNEICPGEVMYFIPNENSEKLTKTYSLYYGDGKSDLNLTSPTDPSIGVFTHTYTTAGSYIYSVDVTNKCGNKITALKDTLIVGSSISNPYYLAMNTASKTEDPTISQMPDWSVRKNATDFKITIPATWSDWKEGYENSYALIFFNTPPTQNATPLALGRYKWPGDAVAYIPLTPVYDSIYVIALWNCDGMIQRGEANAMGMYNKGIHPVASGSLTVPFPGISMNADHWSGSCDDNSACAGDTVGFFALGGTSYKWNFGDGSPVATGQTVKHVYTSTKDSTYKAFVEISNGCGKKDTLQSPAKIGNYRKPYASICLNNEQYCVGDTVNFNNCNYGGGPVTVKNDKYLWDFGDGTSSSLEKPIHVYQKPGYYTVSLIVSNHCGENTTQRFLYVDGPDIQFTTPSTIVKQDDLVPFINNTINAVSFEWKFGNDSVSTKRTPSTKYKNFGLFSVTLKATNARGCVASLTKENYITVQKNPIITNVVLNNVSCNGLANGSIDITVAGGEPPYKYSWTGTGTYNTQDISGLIAGSYTILVTDKNNNTVTASYNVTQPAPFNLPPLVKVNETCFDKGNGSLTANPNGGTAPYSYLWSNGATTQSITNLGHKRFSVVVIDAKKCTRTSTDTIMATYGQMNVGAWPMAMPACGASTGSVGCNVGSGSGSYSYAWNTSPVQTTQNAVNLPARTYKVIVTDLVRGCKDSNFVDLNNSGTTLSANINWMSSQWPSCYGSKDGKVAVNVTGGTGGYSYSWNTTPVQTTSTATNLGAGLWSVTITDGAGCKTNATMKFDQPEQMKLTLVKTDETCPGNYDGSATAYITGGTPNIDWATGKANYIISWSNMWDQPANINIGAGAYTINVEDNRKCKVSGSITINALPALAVTSNIYNVQVRDEKDGAVNVSVANGTPPYSYVWNNGATTQDLENIAAGKYTLNVADSKGCKATSNFTITQPAMLNTVKATVNNTFPMCWGEKATLDAGTGYIKYLWITNISAIPPQTTQKITVDTAMRAIVKAFTNTTYGYDTIDVLVHYPFASERICMVTVDSATGKNKLIWEKTPGKNTQSFNIYKIVGTSNQLIGNIPYGSLTVFKDMTSNPEKSVDRYVISVIDSCGHESIKSPYHQTMLLQAAQGTSINEAVLNWNKYTDEGGNWIPEWYYIYKGKTKETMLLIDSVGGGLESRYNDQKFDGVSAYYMIAIVNPHICDPAGLLKAESGPYSQSLSNIAEYKTGSTPPIENLIGSNAFPVIAYPNPFSNFVTIQISLSENSDVKIETINNIGQKTAEFIYKDVAAGAQHIKLNAADMNIYSGAVYFKVIANEKVSVIKCQFIK